MGYAELGLFRTEVCEVLHQEKSGVPSDAIKKSIDQMPPSALYMFILIGIGAPVPQFARFEWVPCSPVAITAEITRVLVALPSTLPLPPTITGHLSSQKHV